MKVTTKLEETVQLTVKWNEYNYIMIAFKEWIDKLEEEREQSYPELWEIYNKMYMTRKIENKWVNC
jgi:hypothetical protein